MKTISFMSNLTGKNLLTLCMGLVMSGVVVFSSAAAEPGMKTLSGHVPAVVSQLKAKGLLSANTNLDLAIGLPLRNREALTNLLQQIYDPTSANYHKYLTPEQFAEQFGPSEQDYQAVINFAQTNGLTVVRTYSNRMVLDVRGKAADVQNAFHVTLRVYRHPTENRDFFAPDTEPSVPSAMPIQDISGLDSFREPHPKYYKLKSVDQSSVAQPDAGSGLGGSYIGDNFRAAYVPGTSLNGSGQTVALVQFDGYSASDIATYENLAGRTNIPLQNVLIDGFSGSPGANNDEVCLDIEMVISMAPALSKVVVYEGDPFNFHPNDVLNAIATANSARQISCSWGWTGGPTATTDEIFQQMALQGQSFFVSSGDSDAYQAGAVDNPFGDGTPADSPYVTSVGGTTLTMNGTGASYASETVWNWDVEYGTNADGIGSSGGISSFYSIPSWQTNINMTVPKGSAAFRNFPDVALTGDNVFVVSSGGGYGIFGGTSCAAPLWAGFTALVNQQATNNGHASVGFLSPTLYAIAAGTNYANCFHDTTTGNNEWSGSPNLFSAAPGYDLCTGLGTPNGTNLINALTAVGISNTITHLSPPPPPYGTNLAVLNGGNPNGTWYLFVQDDKAFDSGMISNGWLLTLTTANPVGFAADLALTMTSSAANVLAGSNVVCLLTVTNYGPSVATNVIVSDSLPLPSLGTLVSSNATIGSVMRSGETLIWNVSTNLAVNSGGTLTLTFMVNNNFENDAIVRTDTSDPNPDDDSASMSVTVGTLASLRPQLSGSFIGGSHQFQFSISDPTQQAYVIQASTNLVNWVPIYTNPAPATVTTAFTDPNATSYPYRFYRVLLQ
jgi:uncharacterized repeat protein (TIGR01451 family)